MTTSVPTVVRNGDEGDGQTPFGIVVGESTVPETMRLGRDLKSVNLPCFHSVIAKELMGCKEKKNRHVDRCAVFR
ncbi:Hypothetical predicted protein [Olea europaea subsp. europaea]|uniref:Uncharacterized protein n=1 Tax=Olea europaea subsp. europaea TaxID=158383 RepID=A0A8S0QCR4_OLEEU|nr:Hypothetical predicted protein [Olea europaea subsp. europaea]